MAGMADVVGRKLLYLTAEAASLAAAGPSLGAPACECVCAGSSSLLAAGGSGPLAAHGAAEEEGLTPQQRLLFIGVSIFLTVMAGLMSGLTLGLMSLDRVDLEVIKRSGTAKQAWLVERIEPVLSHPHFLLVTLLLTNAAAMETLPIFLDRLTNPLAAIIISVTAVLVFGEIVPQAVCKRYGLQVGARLAWLVRALMLLTAPVSYPIAMLLDYLLGEETALFRRAELKALVAMHAEPPEEGDEAEGPTLTQDEVNVIQGALDMATKTAETAMTPLEKVFMFSADAVINDDLLHQAIERGHSRVPVYEGTRQNIIGLILVKELVLVDEDAGVRIKDLRLREMPFLRADIPLFDVLKIFRTGRSHMAVLTKVGHGRSSLDEATNPSQHGPPRRVMSFGSQQRILETQEAAIGIITIEDVLEELLQQEIVDETDRYVDNLQTVRTSTLISLQHLPPNLRKFLTRTFRVNSPVNRAAFQAALAAQSPFAGAMSPPSTSTGAGPVAGQLQGGGEAGPSAGPAAAAAAAGGGPGGGGGLSSATTSPERPVALAALVAAAAKAASQAEEVAAEGSMHGIPPQRALQQALAQQAQQAAAQQQQARLPTSPQGRLPPALSEELPLLAGQQQGSAGVAQPGSSSLSRASSTGLPGAAGPSPLKPPLPRLRVRTALPAPAARPLLDGVSDSDASPEPARAGAGAGK